MEDVDGETWQLRSVVAFQTGLKFPADLMRVTLVYADGWSERLGEADTIQLFLSVDAPNPRSATERTDVNELRDFFANPY